MERASRDKRLQLLVGLVAVALVAASIWAAAPLAAGGSSGSGESESGPGPPAATVQRDEDAPSAEDCPERERRGEEQEGTSADV